MAGIGWIDFSPEHRNKVATVIERLRPEGRVDELGIGVIRNALSNLFFPGTSTIQTRAKYFIIIPRILKAYQIAYENKKTQPKLKDYLRKQENLIIRILAEKYKDTDEQGIIGSTLVGTPKSRELVRKPSSIYWAGMRQFRIIKTRLSLSEYVASQDKQDSIIDLLAATDQEEMGDDSDAGYDDRFGICLPDNNNHWDEDLSIDLTYEEASFLRDKIIDNNKGSLIGQVLKSKKWMKAFVGLNSFKDMSAFFCSEKLTEEIKTYLLVAGDFDEIINGAHIRYNCLLQERFGTEENLNRFSVRWDQWRQKVTTGDRMIHEFDEDLLFELSQTLRDDTKRFVKEWINGIRKSEPVNFFDRLVIEQERSNKGGKARLRTGATETVKEWIGIDGLSYRFPVARTIVRDIKKGLGV